MKVRNWQIVVRKYVATSLLDYWNKLHGEKRRKIYSNPSSYNCSLRLENGIGLTNNQMDKKVFLNHDTKYILTLFLGNILKEIKQLYVFIYYVYRNLMPLPRKFDQHWLIKTLIKH